MPLWLVFRGEDRRTARVRAVADALIAELRSHEQLLRGTPG